MKLQIHNFIAAVMMVAVATLTVSCELDNVDFNNSDSSTNSGTTSSDDAEVGSGYLSFSSLSLTVDIESEVIATTKADDEINTDSYYVSITNDDPESGQDDITMTYAQIKALSGVIELQIGTYTINARSYESEISALAWDTPEYASKDYSFVITDGETSEVADDIICTLANIKTTVTLTDALLAKFDSSDSDNPLTVTLQLGSVIATYSLNDLGEVVGEGGDVAYFAVQDDDNSITLTLSGMFNTAASSATPSYTKVEWTQEIEDVASGQYRNITINYISSAESGNASFEITVKSSVGDSEISVDIMDGEFFESGEAELDLDNPSTDTETDTPSTDTEATGVTCAIEWQGDYDFDTRYEVSESSYPNIVIDMTSETGITTLLLEIDSDSLTPDLLAMVYLAETMDLINPATEYMEYMLSVELGIPTGDDIEGKTSLTLDITNFMPLLASVSENGDETDFKITLGDASGEVTKTVMVKVVVE